MEMHKTGVLRNHVPVPQSSESVDMKDKVTGGRLSHESENSRRVGQVKW